MSDGTKIEWTDATWNPITGCSVVSAGCRHCYAMKLAGTRLQHHPSREGLTVDTKAGPVWTGEVRLNTEWLDQPLRWRRSRRIFVCAHGDLFHEAVPDEWIDQVFAVMASAPQHTFQVLTKRAGRMREYTVARQHRPAGFMLLPNVWLGVSVEDQAAADERVPLLLQTPAAVRWISAEPLLGPVDLTRLTIIEKAGNRPGVLMNSLTGHLAGPDDMLDAKVDWVVVGGESGQNARPMHPQWARGLRDQCAAAGVPFLFKQWGEWRAPLDSEEYDTTMGRAQRVPAFIVAPSGTVHCFENEQTRDGGCAMLRVGKKSAGRALDGVLHDSYPEAAR